VGAVAVKGGEHASADQSTVVVTTSLTELLNYPANDSTGSEGDTPSVVVVEVESHDGDARALMYGADGRYLSGFYLSNELAGIGPAALVVVPEIGRHVDQQLVQRAATANYRDGASMLRRLGIPYRRILVSELSESGFDAPVCISDLEHVDGIEIHSVEDFDGSTYTYR
jgi:hypothetical protein